MRLIDLDAEFFALGVGRGWKAVLTIEEAQGVCFQCPKCAENLGGEKAVEEEYGRRFVRGVHVVLVWFANPRVLPPVPLEVEPGPGRWTIVKGEGLEDLELSPSIHLKGSGCGWHGYIKNGETSIL